MSKRNEEKISGLALLEKSISEVSAEVRKEVDLSFAIVDRIYEILSRKGLTIVMLARMLNKEESEVYSWMRGNHNFTLSEITKISVALGEDIIGTVQPHAKELEDALQAIVSVFGRFVWLNFEDGQGTNWGKEMNRTISNARELLKSCKDAKLEDSTGR